MSSTEQPKPRHKSFTYTTGLTWIDGKIGTLAGDGKPLIRFSSPPEFKGNAGYWTPEDLFVGSVEMCQMLTFIALAQKQQLQFVSYESNAQGTLECIDGQYKFTHIVISPSVVVEEPATEIQVQTLMREAHKRCFISNSVTCAVEVNTGVVVRARMSTAQTPT